MTEEAVAVSPVSCPFCDRSKDTERIITEDDQLYVVPTLGQITDGGYLLVIPKEHISCLGAMSPDAAERFDKAVEDVRSKLASEYGCLVVGYEHGIVGQTVKHAHYHLVPSDTLASHGTLQRRILTDFPQKFMQTVPTLQELAASYNDLQQPYLLWNTGSVYEICWNPPAPPQYLRIVAADILGRPERANWRQMDPELDRTLVKETTERMRPHF